MPVKSWICSIPLFGFQGKTLDESPYWQLFEDELLIRLPPAGKDLGLPGRVFVAVGNHAIWEDPTISGFRTTQPWLSDRGPTQPQSPINVVEMLSR